MKKLMLMPSCRPDGLATFLRSLADTPALADWELGIYAQAYTPDQKDAIRDSYGAERITRVIYRDDRLAPYMARAECYAAWSDVDVWASLDDDMECLPGMTNYQAPLKWLEANPLTGVISCNWIKSEALFRRARYEQTFLPQALVNMSGGQIYTRQMVDIILRNPILPYLFCDIQVALLAYLEGLTNYRFLGSLLIHRIMGKGGLKTMFQTQKMELPDPRWLPVKPSRPVYGPDNNYYMPDSSQLTVAARERHERRLAERLQEIGNAQEA